MNKYQSEQLGVLHETARALYQIGAITIAEMQEYDGDCLVPASKQTPRNTSLQRPNSVFNSTSLQPELA